MTDSIRRRTLIHGFGVIGIAVSSGCLGNLETAEGESWPEATKNTLTESEIQLISDAGLPPEEVESETDAIRVGMIVGWHRQLNAFDSGRLNSVDSFLQTAEETETVLRDVEQKLEAVDALITKMKDTEISGISAWDVATTISSSARGFDEAVTTSLREVRYWRNLLTSVTESLNRSLEILRTSLQTQTPQGDQLETLATNIDTTLEDLDELESRASGLQENLSTYAEITGTIASNSDQFREDEFLDIANEVETVYGTASELFTEAASKIEAFNQELRAAQSVLAELESGATDYQRDTTNEIRGRYSPG